MSISPYAIPGVVKRPPKPYEKKSKANVNLSVRIIDKHKLELLSRCTGIMKSAIVAEMLEIYIKAKPEIEQIMIDPKSVLDLKCRAITDYVARKYHIKPELLFEKKRDHEISEPRMVAITFMREAGISLYQCRDFFGFKNHASAAHCYKAIRNRYTVYPEFREKLTSISKGLDIQLKFKNKGQW